MRLRDLFMWLGVAVAPLTLVYATSRAMLGESEPVALPTLRVLAICVVIVSYPYWWQQAAALADQITHTILALPAVSRGLYKLMEYAVDGVALGGWQLIDLGLMGAIALALLALIFLKVVVILLGALLYATGPLMIGLVATEAGSAAARAWVSAVGLLFALGICWAALFAVGALLIGDASTAGPLIAGSSDIRDADRRAVTRDRRAREPVAVPEGRQGSGRAVADAARWPARDLKSTARRYQDQQRSPAGRARPANRCAITAPGSRGAAAAAGGELAGAGAGGARDRGGSSHRWPGRPTRDSRERRSGRRARAPRTQRRGRRRCLAARVRVRSRRGWRAPAPPAGKRAHRPAVRAGGPAGASGSEVDAESRRTGRCGERDGRDRARRTASAPQAPRRAAGLLPAPGRRRAARMAGAAPARSAPPNRSQVSDTPARPDSAVARRRPGPGVPPRSPARPSTPRTAPAPR